MKPRKVIRSLAVSLVLVVIAGCTSMKPKDFETEGPELKIEEFFAGRTQAWGLFEDRFGTLRRRFVVETDGTWDGSRLVLQEDFLFSDGERDQRTWTITKLDEHRYEGQADDVIGTAVGESRGNALNWSYIMDLKVGDGTMRVRFDDWMFLQTDGIMINRARVSKWGLEIGQVTLVFMKDGLIRSGAGPAGSGPQFDALANATEVQ